MLHPLLLQGTQNSMYYLSLYSWAHRTNQNGCHTALTAALKFWQKLILFRPRQGNLRLVFRLFKSHPRQSLGLDLNNLKTCLRFPSLGLNPIIDSSILLIVGFFSRRAPSIFSGQPTYCPSSWHAAEALWTL